jgi:hypothetical protein
VHHRVTYHSLIHEAMKRLFEDFAPTLRHYTPMELRGPAVAKPTEVQERELVLV